MTPISKAIKLIIDRKNLSQFESDKQKCDTLIGELKSLLPYEKEWAEKVWEACNKWNHGEHMNQVTGATNPHPDFNTFYSQYNQEK